MNASEIEDEFFRHFPRSKAKRPFSNHMVTAAARHIKAQKIINAKSKAADEKTIAKYNETIPHRGVKSFDDLGKEEKEEIRNFVNVFELHTGKELEKLYLTGSFIEGHWRTKDTAKSIAKLIEVVKGKKGISDIDLHPFPLEDISLGRCNVHVDPWSTLLIYEKGKYI